MTKNKEPMKEYSVHIINAWGDEYYMGHYRNREDAESGAKKFHDNPRMKKVYIAERDVTEWRKSDEVHSVQR